LTVKIIHILLSLLYNRRFIETHFRLSIETNPFQEKNQTLRCYRVIILPTRTASTAELTMRNASIKQTEV